MLYFVATPIGNLSDISKRALDILNNVDEIGCEDTRTSQKLLNHYQIAKPLFSYHKFNEISRSEKVIEKLKQGKNIAIISDSGTPVISDPGNVLCKRLHEENIVYTTIPGANAAISALLLSGLKADKFMFVGFLPEKNAEFVKTIENIKYLQATLIFHVAPHNVEKMLGKLFEKFGARNACLVCEITKKFERKYNFVLGENPEIFTQGEMVLVVDGYTKGEEETDMSIEEHVAFYMAQDKTKMEAIKQVAKDRAIDKSIIYNKINK